MKSQEKRRDTEKLQNKRRRQKWHFLRDCYVAFVGRKMKCEDQGETGGGRRGHGGNGMSWSQKQKRKKCARGKTNLWEMSQESVRLPAAVWWIGRWRSWWGRRVFAVWWTEQSSTRTSDMNPLRQPFRKITEIKRERQQQKKWTFLKWEMNM